MSKITEYEVASAFDANDVLLKDGENGTMIISVENAAQEFKRLGGIDDDISGINQSVTQAMDTIASNIAGVETDYIASKDYAIGDLFIVNNVLYKATAAIAEEDVIDTEINCAIVNLGDEIGDIRSELSNKANVDGSYSTLTAGNAEQLVGTVFTEDDAAYTFRTAGGSADIGDREYDEIVGGSIVWNQVIRNGNFADGVKNWSALRSGSVIDATDGVLSYTLGSADIAIVSTYENTVYSAKFNARILGDSVVFVSGYMMPKYNHIMGFYFAGEGGTSNTPFYKDCIGNKWNDVSGVVKLRGWSNYLQLQFNSRGETGYSEGDIVYAKNIRVHDLTQMFGSEIADYIYNLEQTTPGAGVAWFRKYFPKDYYEYNAGELMHVSDLQSHDMVGFNQISCEVKLGGTYTNGIYTYVPNDKGHIATANKIKCLPGTVYCASAPNVSNVTTSLYIIEYDCNENYLRFSRQNLATTKKLIFTTSNDACYIALMLYRNPTDGTFDASEAANICINLSWDGERDGEYEPYVKHSYPLDSSLTLRGILKLSTDGKLYYDGDHYKSDGAVERRYGIVDLGTLNWWYQTSSATPRFGITISDCKKLVGGSAWKGINVIISTSKYTRGGDVGQESDAYGFWGVYNGAIYVTDSDYTDAESFKAAMSGVYLVYELAEPTTEEAQPFQSPQIVDDFGTEEYVTSSIVPVGHITQYDSNLRAKLEMAPNSPDGDGNYLVRQTGGKNEYVPYADGGRITALESKIPAAPSANGGYILKCTVTDGTATYAWVAE